VSLCIHLFYRLNPPTERRSIVAFVVVLGLIAMGGLVFPANVHALDCGIDNGDFEQGHEVWSENCDRQGEDAIIVGGGEGEGEGEGESGNARNGSGYAQFKSSTISGIDQTLTQKVTLPIVGVDPYLSQPLNVTFSGLDQDLSQTFVMPRSGIDDLSMPFTMPSTPQRLVHQETFAGASDLVFWLKIPHGGDPSDVLKLTVGTNERFAVNGVGNITNSAHTDASVPNPLPLDVYVNVLVHVPDTGNRNLAFELSNGAGVSLFYLDDIEMAATGSMETFEAGPGPSVLWTPTPLTLVVAEGAYHGTHAAKFGWPLVLSFMLKMQGPVSPTSGDILVITGLGTIAPIPDDVYSHTAYTEITIPIRLNIAPAPVVNFEVQVGNPDEPQRSVFLIDDLRIGARDGSDAIPCVNSFNFDTQCSVLDLAVADDAIISVPDAPSLPNVLKLVGTSVGPKLSFRYTIKKPSNNGEDLFTAMLSGVPLMVVDSTGVPQFPGPYPFTETPTGNASTVEFDLTSVPPGSQQELRFVSHMIGATEIYVDNICVPSPDCETGNRIQSGDFEGDNTVWMANTNLSAYPVIVLENEAAANHAAHFGGDLKAELRFFVKIEDKGHEHDVDYFAASVGGDEVFRVNYDGSDVTTYPEYPASFEYFNHAHTFDDWVDVKITLPLEKILNGSELKFSSKITPRIKPTFFNLEDVSITAPGILPAGTEVVQNGLFTQGDANWTGTAQVEGSEVLSPEYAAHFTIPRGGKMRLNFQFRIEAGKGNTEDSLTVSLAGSEVFKAVVDADGNVTFAYDEENNHNPNEASYTGENYKEIEFDVSTVAGGEQSLEFHGVVTGTTLFYVDDVCLGEACPDDPATLVSGGDFSDASVWDDPDKAIRDVGDKASSTPYAAVFGFVSETCTLSQSFVVPFNRSVLSFYLKMPAALKPDESLVVSMAGKELATYNSATTAVADYTEQTFDISEHVSSDEKELKFESTLNNGSGSAIYVDDVCLGLGTGGWINWTDCNISNIIPYASRCTNYNILELPNGQEFTVTVTVENLGGSETNAIIIKPQEASLSDGFADELIAENPEQTGNTLTATFTLPGAFTLFDDGYHGVEGLARIYLRVNGLFIGLEGDLARVVTVPDNDREFVIDMTPPDIVLLGTPDMYLSDYNGIGNAGGMPCYFPNSWRGTYPLPYNDNAGFGDGNEPFVFFDASAEPYLQFTFKMSFQEVLPVDPDGVEHPVITSGFCMDTGGLTLGTTDPSVSEILDGFSKSSDSTIGIGVVDLVFLPGTARWSDGANDWPDSTEASRPVYNLDGDVLTVLWPLQNISFAGDTSWVKNAGFDVADLAGNVYSTPRLFNIWWERDPHARLEADFPKGITIAEPILSWTLDRDENAAPKGAEPCKPVAQVALWHAIQQDAPPETADWEIVLDSDWSCGNEKHTIDMQWPMTEEGMTLGSLLARCPNEWVMLTVAGADEAGNAQPNNVGSTTTFEELEAKDIEYWWWHTPGGYVLDTTATAQFWYEQNGVDYQNPPQPDAYETQFGSSTRIPLLPLDACGERIEAAFTITPGMADTSDLNTLFAEWELFEDSRQVAAGRIRFSGGGPVKLYIPDTLILLSEKAPSQFMDIYGYSMAWDCWTDLCESPDKPQNCPSIRSFMNIRPPKCENNYVDQLGDNGDESQYRKRDVNYLLSVRTVEDPTPGDRCSGDEVKDATPASIAFTVYVEAPLRDEQPVKMINRE